MAASVHRLAPSVEPPRFGPAPLHRGERTTCPGCATARHLEKGWNYEDRWHGPSALRLGSWWVCFWRRCKERRNHYHQRCLDCGARWIVGFLEDI